MRVIRILVYEGDEKVIDRTMKHNAVKAFRQIHGLNITEALIGYEYPTVAKELSRDELNDLQHGHLL